MARDEVNEGARAMQDAEKGAGPEGGGESDPTGSGGWPPPDASRPDFVRLGLLFYGGLIAAALVWRMGFYGESILFATASDAARASSEGVRWGRDLLIGLAAGGFVIALSDFATRRWLRGERLARSLARALGPIGRADALLLALASGLGEELLFRGALQPRVGLVLASLLFACAHFVPRRELLPWTAFALLAGLFFGLLYKTTGNILAPVAAHTLVNAVNLPLLVRRYGERAVDTTSPPG